MVKILARMEPQSWFVIEENRENCVTLVITAA